MRTGHDTNTLDAVSTGMRSGRHDGAISADDHPSDPDRPAGDDPSLHDDLAGERDDPEGDRDDDDWDDDWDEDDADPGVMALPLRAVVPLDDGTFYVNLPPMFRAVLHHTIEDLRHRIVMGDDSTRRLFPTAYPDDPALDAEYRRLMGDELLRSRFGALDTVTETLDLEVLDADQAAAWLQAMNALRLAFGTELGVDHDEWELPEDDPRLALYDLYTYLGYLVGSIIDALRHVDAD